MSRLPQIVAVALLVVVVGSLDACQGSRQSASTDPSAEQSAAQAPAMTDAEIKYGVSPTLNSQVTYQPDVIVMEHGAEAIRSISSNGLTYTIDANAPGANEIQPDKVLMATGRVVGRVLAVERKGNGLAVTLGPVELTDVFKEAHVHYQGTLDTSKMIVYRSAPDYPGTSVDLDAPDPNATGPASTMRQPDKASIRVANLSSVGEWGSLPTVQRGMRNPPGTNSGREQFPGNTAFLVYQAQDSNSACNNAIDNTVIKNASPITWSGCDGAGGAPAIEGFNLGGAHFSPDISHGFSAAASYDKAPLKFFVFATLNLNHPVFTFNLDIHDGRLNTAEIEMALNGELRVGFNGGTHGDVANYAKLAELPMDASIPIPLHPPFAATFQQAILIRTMFTAKNGVINATGEYALSGMIKAGIVNGNKVGSSDVSLKVKQSLAESLTGGSFGVNGLVLGWSGRITAGIGALAFVVGPYANIKAVVGVTRSSDLAGPVLGHICGSGEFHMWLAFGVGFAAPKWTQAVSNAITGFLSYMHIIKPRQVNVNYSKELGTAPILDIPPEYVPASCAPKA